MQTGFDDARTEVRALADSADIGVAVRELVGDPTQADQSTLKIGEYALLIAPLSQGLERFLEVPAGGKAKKLRPSELAFSLSDQIIEQVVPVVEADPNYALMEELHKHRENAPPGFRNNLVMAIRSSAGAMLINAIANMAVIQNAQDPRLRERPKLLDAVERSTQLVLNSPRVHLFWNFTAGQEIRELSEHYIAGRYAENKDAMRYDWERLCAVLTKPLAQWVRRPDIEEIAPSATPITISEIPAPDVKIGCPMSFDPKLLIRYYQVVVRAIEHHRSWPDVYR
jgi:hypothetical protein